MSLTWTAADVSAALNVPSAQPFTATGVSIDTRTLQKGDLFVALSGVRDGHDFVPDALAKGAAAAVVSRSVATQIPQFIVPDVQKALELLGAYGRARARAVKAVTVTGSNGKTSTKEMLAALLGAHASVASYNNHFGVPLTLARLPADATYGIFEVGMSAPGEIAPLSRQVKPDVALVTSVGPAHLERMGSLDAIRIEKLSIAAGLGLTGTLVLPLDVAPENIPQRLLRFSLTQKADTYVESLTEISGGWRVKAVVGPHQVGFDLHMDGCHQVHNALGALTCVWALGADVQAAAERLNRVTAYEGRGNVIEVAGVAIVNESYNANPASMRATLETFRRRPVTGRRIAVLGDMREIGPEGPRFHADLADSCTGLDAVVTVGPLMAHLAKALPKGLHAGHVDSAPELNLARFVGNLKAGDAIMFKASNGTGLGPVVTALKTDLEKNKT
jgi:UDP-N-acetylmuramoyl-tripeptide--D-alanyl-D-alanine ligase